VHSAPSSFKSAVLGGALAFGVVLGLGGAGLSHANPAPSPGAVTQKQKVIVHLKHGTDDLHAAAMAFMLATEMARQGAAVTLFVDLEAVRLVDSRQPLGLRWGIHERTIGQLYDSFIAAGGAILVCPHCAELIGLRGNILRRGTAIVPLDQIAGAMLAADKVLDY
jgi:predicted peroxiredoxin